MAEPAPPPRVAAVVLAGGAGQRLGGRDKGLFPYAGHALVDHVLDGLRRQRPHPPAALALNANRQLGAYAQRHLPVLRDAPDWHACGPLAGLERALVFAQTQACAWTWIVPCDSPALPSDLLAQLLAAAQAGLPSVARAAFPSDPRGDRHPTHALVPSHWHASLVGALRDGERSLQRWLRQQGAVEAAIDRVLRNLNRPEDFDALPVRIPTPMR